MPDLAIDLASGGSAVPSGPAGGDLDGTYPDPEVAAVHETGGGQRLAMGSIAAAFLLARMTNDIVGQVPIELAPGVETSTGFLYGGSVVYAQRFTGASMPAGGTGTLVAGVDMVVLALGFATAASTSARHTPPSGLTAQVFFVVDTSDNLSIGNNGTGFDATPYDYTAWYTKV